MRGGKFLSVNNFSAQEHASSKNRHILNFGVMAVRDKGWQTYEPERQEADATRRERRLSSGWVWPGRVGRCSSYRLGGNITLFRTAKFFHHWKPSPCWPVGEGTYANGFVLLDFLQCCRKYKERRVQTNPAIEKRPPPIKLPGQVDKQRNEETADFN